MAPVMEDNMMAMLDVEEASSVAVITVRSSEPTTTRRMTAVKSQTVHLLEVLVEVLGHLEEVTGVTGAPGVSATKDVVEERE